MRLSLIQLPYHRSTTSAIIPLGLVMLGTAAKQHGYHVKIIDLDLLIKQGRLSTDSSFFKSAAKEIIASRADVYCFSPICHSFPASLLIAKECKKLASDKLVVFGGPEASFQDTETLRQFPFVNLIVRGEGEAVLLEVLKALTSGKDFSSIKGITYRERKKVVRNPDQDLIDDLDTLPYPDYSLHPAFKNASSIARLVETIPVEGGRGCPYACTFCSTRQTWRGKFRLKSPRRIANEIRHIKKVYGKNIPIELVHDNFTVDRNALLEFCKQVPKGTTWRINSRIDLLDKTMIRKLSESGCDYMLIGIESGSSRIQKLIRKNIDLEQAYKNIKLINMSAITPRYTFMMGFPEERAEDINKTISFALRCACLMNESNVQLNLLALTAPCSLYQKHGQAILIDPDPNIFTHFIVSRITNSRREWEFIKRHKKSFPVYSLVKSEHYDTQYLFKMNTIFTFLIQHMPLTTQAILRLLTLTPIELADDVIPYFDRYGPKRLGLFWARHSYRIKYLGLLRKYIKDIGKKDIRELLLNLHEHESSLVQCIFLSNWKSDTSTLPTSLSKLRLTRPRLARGVLIKRYSYDLNPLIASIQSDRDIAHPKNRDTVIAYAPLGMADSSVSIGIGFSAVSLQLSPLAQLLIEYCNGRSTVNEITLKAHKEVREINFKEFSRACEKSISYLIDEGMLHI